MAMAKITVNGYRGDSASFAITVTRGGEPADFSEAVVRSQLREDTESSGISSSPPLDEWSVDINGNTLTFSLTPAQTEQLPVSSKFDVEVDWLGDRSQIQTIAIGALNTPKDITLKPVGP